VLAIVTLALLLDGPTRLMTWLRVGGVRSVTAFGVEVSLSQEAAEQNEQSFEETLDRYRVLIDQRIEHLLNQQRAKPLWERLVREGIIPTFSAGLPEDFRCTLYVPDPLLGERVLYQLVDYYPKGGGRGRRLSWRFGAVGRAWRLEQDDVWPGVETEATQLVEIWGMSFAEADTAGRGRAAIGCVLLRRPAPAAQPGKGPIVGLLYMDSSTPAAFGESVLDTGWLTRVESIQVSVDSLDFAAVVDDVIREVRGVTPTLKISLDSGGSTNAVP
jgi:hypothetical protein